MEGKDADEPQGQQPQRSDMPLENRFYSRSLLPVPSLQANSLLSVEAHSPGVHFKASSSKLIAAGMSLLSSWILTTPAFPEYFGTDHEASTH